MSERQFTHEELAACALREVGMRKRVYPHWIEKGRMTQAKADVEIAMMHAIFVKMNELATSERLL